MDDNTTRSRPRAGGGRPADTPLQRAQGAERLLRGTPVFGRDDERLGTLCRDGYQDGHLWLLWGAPDGEDGTEVAVPANAVVRSDASGIYTSLSTDDIRAALPRSDRPAPGSPAAVLDALSRGAEGAHANRFPDDEPA